MKRWLPGLLWIACALVTVARAQAPKPAANASTAALPFESEIRAFAEDDRRHPRQPGGILFVGSSIFRQWTNVANAMAPMPALNRAFGGSKTGDQLARFESVVTPHAPSILVYYCGSNDLKAGDDPEAIFQRFKAFSERVDREFPLSHLVYVSSTRSPDRVDKWGRVDRYNGLVRDYLANRPLRTFVDLNPALFDRAGKPRLELYQADQLHFLPHAYDEFTRVIKPVVARLWNERARAAGNPASATFPDMHLGLFAHYTYVGKAYEWGWTEWADGTPVRSLDELADHLDVEDFARTAAAMRAQYVLFTTFHANMNVLFPSTVMQRHLPGHSSQRDAVGDLVRALKARGIRTILYFHPTDGHDLTPDDQNRVGWNEPAPSTRWNDFINELLGEIVDRYGKDVAGYYFDGGLPKRVDPPRLRKTVLDRQPGAWLIQNSGLNRACVDYGATEDRMKPPYPPTTWLRCQTITDEWWAKHAVLSWSPELAYRYTVLQAAVTGRMGGGTAWSFGPHPGGRWELGVRSFCDRLGQLIDTTGPSLFNTRPSRAYVVTNQPLESLSFVATESPDGHTTFLHQFRPQRERVLELPPPADARRFASARLLSNGNAIALQQSASGVRLTLGSADTWDDVDTIVVLEE